MSLVARVRAVVAAFQASGFGRLIQHYGQDRADLLATIIAFNALFSMFPIILVILALVGLVLRSPDVLAQAQALVVGTLPAQAADSVLAAIDGTRQAAGLFGVLSLIGLLWGGSGLFGALELALDRVYRVPVRPFVQQKLMAVAMMALFAFLLIVVLTSSSLAQLAAGLTRLLPVVGSGVAQVLALAGGAISLVAAFALCFAIYYFVPNVDLTPGQVLPGTAFASLALVLLAQIFPVYTRYVGGFNQYGAIFGLFFLLMTWSYLVAQTLLFGAELNALLRPVARRVAGTESTPGRERPIA